jgi:hypothetical protein
MYVRPKYRRPANAAFFDHVGNAIRQATSDIVQAELPEDIRSLLNALERLEQERARNRLGGPVEGVAATECSLVASLAVANASAHRRFHKIVHGRWAPLAIIQLTHDQHDGQRVHSSSEVSSSSACVCNASTRSSI